MLVSLVVYLALARVLVVRSYCGWEVLVWGDESGFHCSCIADPCRVSLGGAYVHV